MKKKIAKNSRAVFPYPMSELLYDFLKYHPIYLMKSDDKKERKKNMARPGYKLATLQKLY